MILIKHVELRHSVAKKSQNAVWNTDPVEKNASVKNGDPLEKADTSTVPLENSHPVSNDVDPLEVSIKDKYEDIQSQQIKSEKNKENNTVKKFTTSIHEGKKVFKCDMCSKNFQHKQS